VSFAGDRIEIAGLVPIVNVSQIYDADGEPVEMKIELERGS